MMSDEEGDTVIDSIERRAHHNAVERKRRDNIKYSFSNLRDSVPSLRGEKVASKALILKTAADYIQLMKENNTAREEDIVSLKRQNVLLEEQIRHSFEEIRPNGVHSPLTDDESDVGETSDHDGNED